MKFQLYVHSEAKISNHRQLCIHLDLITSIQLSCVDAYTQKKLAIYLLAGRPPFNCNGTNITRGICLFRSDLS